MFYLKLVSVALPAGGAGVQHFEKHAFVILERSKSDWTPNVNAH